MKKIAAKISSSKNKYVVIAVLLGILVFWSQIGKLLTFFRNRLTGMVNDTDTIKAVANDTGLSSTTVKQTIRIETCKGVAETCHAMLHEKPLGFIPVSWFGSVENETGLLKQLNSLKNGNEAKYVSSYYYQKYQERLKPLLYKYMDAFYSKIIPEIKNNLS